MEYFQKAAELNEPSAINMIGYYYDNGYYYKKDWNKAFEYYLKAAKLDYITAIYNVGICYETGRGINIDFKKAVEYYKKASDKGHKNAYASLYQKKFDNYR